MLPEKKDAVISRFRHDPDARLLVLTESGGEGRNLQFSHIIVNYDLPWNPMKVEQRIGRLDRLTQEHDVEIHNLALAGTIEERVLDILHDRIRLFEETVGGLDPILEPVESEIAAAALSPECLAPLEERIADDVRKAREAEKRLEDLVLDRTSYRREAIDKLLRERSELARSDLEHFFKRYCCAHRIGFSENDRVLSVRAGFRARARRLASDNRTRTVTFDAGLARARDDLELCGFGHELFDAAIAESLENRGRGATVAVVRDGVEREESGILLVYELSIGGIRPERVLLPYYATSGRRPSRELGERLLRARLDGPSPDRDPARVIEGIAESIDAWAEEAEDLANEEMQSRKDARAREQDRLFQAERQHIDRHFAHRIRGLERSLEDKEKVAEELRALPEDNPSRKILPVWEKQAEDARSALEEAKRERSRRLEELEEKRRPEIGLELVLAAAIVRVPTGGSG